MGSKILKTFGISSLVCLSVIIGCNCNPTEPKEPEGPKVEISSIKLFYAIGKEYPYTVVVNDTVPEDSMPFKFEGVENWYLPDDPTFEEGIYFPDVSFSPITSKGIIHVVVGLITGKNLALSSIILKNFGGGGGNDSICFYSDSTADSLDQGVDFYGRHFLDIDTTLSNGLEERALIVIYTSPAQTTTSGYSANIEVYQGDERIDFIELYHQPVKWRNGIGRRDWEELAFEGGVKNGK